MHFSKALVVIVLFAGLVRVQNEKMTTEPSNLNNFVPFGQGYGDSMVPKGVGWYVGPIDIYAEFPFFNRTYWTVFICIYGLVTFNGPISSAEFVPLAFFSHKLSGVAVFWNHIDIQKGGEIFYRQIREKKMLDAIATDIRRAFWQHFNFRPSFAFVVTWFQIASFSFREGRNTFQVVIVTNGKHSFAILNYNKIEWWISTLIDNYALAGINAGDGVHFETIEGSLSDEMATLPNRSNVNVPGKFIYKIDGVPLFDGCIQDGDMVSIRPGVVPFTGEHEIKISGPCFNETDHIELFFPNETVLAGSDRVRCSLVDRETAVCKTVFFNRIGNHDVMLQVNNAKMYKGRLVVRYLQESDAFYGLEPYYEAQPATSSTSTSKISWDRGFDESPFESYSVIYSLIDDKNSQTPYQVLAESISSSAADAFIVLDVIWQAIKSSLADSEHFKAIFHVAKNESERLVIFKTHVADVWNIGLNKLNDCDAWHEKQPDPWPIMNSLPPCSRVVPTSFPKNVENFEWDTFCNPNNRKNCAYKYHSSTYGCYRDVSRPFAGSVRPNKKCCYDAKGVLYASPSQGGTLDLVNPDDDILGNFKREVVPWRKCCVIKNECGKYYEKRPSDDGARWQMPGFGGGFGDPHFLTLDGLDYTFNGQGEYTLLRVDEADLEVQVRLMPYKTRYGMPASDGTVFKAIAVKAAEHDSVQIELSESNQLIFYLNGVVFDGFEDELMHLRGVVVRKNQDHYTIQYSVGVSIEVSMTPEMDALAIVVTASQVLKGKTEGLLGVMYQDIKNDFTLPSGQVLSLFAANDRVVFEKFAVHWQTTESSSVFTYMDGFGHSSFVDTAYKPKFMSDGIAFENKTLEQMAKSLCKDNQQCLFDVATTKQLGLGSLSLEFDEAIKESEKNNEIAKQTCVHLFDHFENGRRLIKNLDSGFEYTASCNKDFCFEHDQKQEKVLFRCEKGRYDRQIPSCVRCCTSLNSSNLLRFSKSLLAATIVCLSLFIAIFLNHY